MSRGTRGIPRSQRHFVYGAVTLCGLTFQNNSTITLICNSCAGPHNPAATSDRGLGWSPFARRYSGNRFCFLFLKVLRCFNSLGIAPLRLCVQRRVTRYEPGRVSPFGNLRLKRPLAPTRSLSQLATSFIACSCQGIRRTPLKA